MTSILVTGANRGIGLEFVRQYAKEGARVFACCRKPGKAKELSAVAEASRGGVSLHALDVTDGNAIAALAHALRKETLDVLINNAGIDGTPEGKEIDDSLWISVFRVNSIAPYRMARAFHDMLRKSRAPKIVTISSRLGSIGLSNGYAMDYGASKAAANYVMHALAARWGSDGFVCVALSPGWVKTDMGGEGAPLTPQQSVGGMRKVIAGLNPAQNGKFLGYRGEELPW